MKCLQSYVQGQWISGTGTATILQNAITGEPVAQIKSGGLDTAALLNHARTEGRYALQKLTFHERALKLKQLALHLLEHKQEFYALSSATGATQRDSWIDIEGGIQALFSYSGTGRRELPNARFIVDGITEPLSKNGSFVGQHIQVPIEGAAMHINAFNFPCWGMLEKLSVSLLAGVPSIVKPASSSAFLTALMFQRIIESGIFPEGSLQFISGSVGDLFEHLDYQDCIAFTGSASTGQMLRNHPIVQSNSIRFLMESDSLNCSILGPDSDTDSPEFMLYIRQIVDEISIKCGQRCTSIRRAIIPENLADAVAEVLRNELDKISIGDPDNCAVDMGALINHKQREDVRDAISELQKDAQIIYGDPFSCDVLDADSQQGAFLSPIILRCENPLSSHRVHHIEAFGPVTTIMPYKNNNEMLELARLGQGSLVASIATYDNCFAADAVFALAAHHGRILLLNRDCAVESTGHGAPLPRLLHGGPGRAGGGEEMGGLRSIKHYLQTAALQGSPDQLSSLIGQWIPGSARNHGKQHPFRKTFNELKIGDSLTSESRTITLDDIEHFAEFTGDNFYAHMDEAAAKANPFFAGRVAHGYLIVSLAAGLFVEPNPGPVLANYGVDNLRFLLPVYTGDDLKVALTCKQKTDRIGEVYGEVRWHAEITNQDEAVIARYDVLTMVANL